MPTLIEPRRPNTVIGRLRADGYRVAGPTVRDDAIVYDELAALRRVEVGR